MTRLIARDDDDDDDDDGGGRYAISEPETVSVVVPASMLASEQVIFASPAFVIEVAGAVGTTSTHTPARTLDH